MSKSVYIRSKSPIDNSTLAAHIPSAYATQAWQGVSNRYAFLPTAEVIHALQANGLACLSAKQSGTRKEGKEGYTKHSLRFRVVNSIYNTPILGEVFPEVILTNSHDRGSSFIVEMGLYRTVCSNGLVVAIGSLSSFRVRHVSSTIDGVLESVQQVINQFPLVEETVRALKAKTLTITEAEKYSELALGLRYDMGKAPFSATRLLSLRRTEDAGYNLWSVYNVIQENLTGQTIRRNRAEHSSRAIRSIDSDLGINRGLWALTQSFA